MNILVTLDRNYLPPLRVMLGSLFLNNPGETFSIYLVGDGLTEEDWAELERICAPHGRLCPVSVPEDLFAAAPVLWELPEGVEAGDLAPYRLLNARGEALNDELYSSIDHRSGEGVVLVWQGQWAGALEEIGAEKLPCAAA